MIDSLLLGWQADCRSAVSANTRCRLHNAMTAHTSALVKYDLRLAGHCVALLAKIKLLCFVVCCVATVTH
jgi:hypothetical protein